MVRSFHAAVSMLRGGGWAAAFSGGYTDYIVYTEMDRIHCNAAHMMHLWVYYEFHKIDIAMVNRLVGKREFN